jgi:hypothetical protein
MTDAMPLQILGATDADGCEDGFCAVPQPEAAAPVASDG